MKEKIIHYWKRLLVLTIILLIIFFIQSYQNQKNKEKEAIRLLKSNIMEVIEAEANFFHVIEQCKQITLYKHDPENTKYWFNLITKDEAQKLRSYKVHRLGQIVMLYGKEVGLITSEKTISDSKLKFLTEQALKFNFMNVKEIYNGSYQERYINSWTHKLSPNYCKKDARIFVEQQINQYINALNIIEDNLWVIPDFATRP